MEPPVVAGKSSDDGVAFHPLKGIGKSPIAAPLDLADLSQRFDGASLMRGPEVVNVRTIKEASAQSEPTSVVGGKSAAGLNIVVPEHLRDLERHVKLPCPQLDTAFLHGDVKPVQGHIVGVEIVESENALLVAVC